MTTAETTATAATEDLDPRRWIALGVVLTASFMVLLDISIVNVAIPSIQTNLNATFGQIQLILALYQLAYAVVLITGGRMGDIFGRKRLFMIGMGGFVVASALCGAAQTPEILIIARVFQGVMAALMYPQVLSVIQVSFPPRERAKAFGLFGAIIGLASIVGPLLGGLLIQANLLGLDWRPIFLVNVPVGIASLVAAAVLMHESRSPNALRLDLIGVVVVSTALFLLIWPLVEGRDAGWPAWAYICLIASAPVFAVFVVFEVRRARTTGSPLVEPDLFRDRAFTIGLLISLLFIAGIPSFFLTFSLFVQIGLGFSALHAGVTTLPFALGSLISSAASGRIASTMGKKILIIGNAVLIAGLLLLVLSIHLAGVAMTSLEIYPALFICGLGLGAVIAPLINVILAGIHTGDAGSASGVLTTVQQVGGAIGVAVIGVIFFGLLSSNAGQISRDIAPAVQRDLVRVGLPVARANVAVQSFQKCFRDRSSASDPTAVPASCHQAAQSGPASQVFRRAADTARGQNFIDAFNLAVVFDIVLFAATLLLAWLLPAASTALAKTGAPAGGH